MTLCVCVFKLKKKVVELRKKESHICRAELKSTKSTSDWQQALEDAQLDGQKNPLPLEVFKVRLRDLQEDQVQVNYG